MDAIVTAVAFIARTKVRCDDDFVDRLSHRYSCFVLIVFAIVVTSGQYAGEPIHCWCPAQFTYQWENYANQACWVKNTYYVPFEQPIPDKDVPKESEIVYYQWVPIILLCQAVLFYAPCIFWSLLNKRSGIKVSQIVETSLALHRATYSESRDKLLRYISKHIDQYLIAQPEYRQDNCLYIKQKLAETRCAKKIICGKKFGNYMVLLYLCVKGAYVLNAVCQLFILNAFLRTDYHMYGAQVVEKLMQGEDFTVSPRFPRVTLCDFEIRQLGNIHRYTLQCVLQINLFNEKIYIFLWFWLVFVAIVSLGSFISWLVHTIMVKEQIMYVRRHLRTMGRYRKDKDQDKRLLIKFVNEYLRQDGILVLRLAAANTSEIVSAELLAQLWDTYTSKGHVHANNVEELEEMM